MTPTAPLAGADMGEGVDRPPPEDDLFVLWAAPRTDEEHAQIAVPNPISTPGMGVRGPGSPGAAQGAASTPSLGGPCPWE
jgi:hypothetical protein